MTYQAADLIIDFLKIATVVFSGTGSYFWIRRNVWSSSSSIAELAKLKWSYSPAVVKELSGQRADSLVAWSYIFMATLAQAAAFFIPNPTRFDSSVPFGWHHIIYGLITFVILFISGNYISRKVEKNLNDKTLTILQTKKENKV